MPDNRPCGGCERGSPYDGPFDAGRQCYVCWLHHSAPAYRVAWDAPALLGKLPRCPYLWKRARDEKGVIRKRRCESG